MTRTIPFPRGFLVRPHVTQAVCPAVPSVMGYKFDVTSRGLKKSVKGPWFFPPPV